MLRFSNPLRLVLAITLQVHTCLSMMVASMFQHKCQMFCRQLMHIQPMTTILKAMMIMFLHAPPGRMKESKIRSSRHLQFFDEKSQRTRRRLEHDSIAKVLLARRARGQPMIKEIVQRPSLQDGTSRNGSLAVSAPAAVAGGTETAEERERLLPFCAQKAMAKVKVKVRKAKDTVAAHGLLSTISRSLCPINASHVTLSSHSSCSAV